MKTVKVEMARIRRDDRVQSRAHLDIAAINEYAEAMSNGKEFPPVVVYDDGDTLWLSEGFHRHAATDQVGWLEIMAEVRQGTFEDAVLNSAAANQTNGVRRSNEDKRRAVEMVLSAKGEWSNQQISEWVGVSPTTVASIRTVSLSKLESDAPRTYTTKHGTVATMRVGNIGHSRPAPEPLDLGDEDEGATGFDEEQEEQEQDETTGEEEQSSSTEKPLKRFDAEVHSSGKEFALMAILQLQRIHKKDCQRAEAWAMVRAWLDKNE